MDEKNTPTALGPTVSHHQHHDPHAGHDAHAGHETHEAHAGHSEHAGHDPAVFRRKFWLTLVLTIPALVFSPGLQDILGLAGPRFPGSQYIPAVFGVAIFFSGGLVFLRGAVDELRSKQPGMMTLISLAIVVAFGYSVAVTFGLPGMDFWWELATLILIMLFGHWIEMSAVMGAQDALGELAELLPDTAERLPDIHAEPQAVAVADLRVGDLVRVRPGSAIPADGEIVDGRSELDESLLTGESQPVTRGPGEQVVAGSISGSGSLVVRVTRTGDDTALAGIVKLVSDAQASKSGTQVLADRAAAWLFSLALAVAIVTLIVWLILRPGDPAFILERVVTVLIIACPHALGLAIPLVAQISTSIGARKGLLIRDRHAMEDARNIDVVLFDKTGTLTEGRQGVVAVVAEEGDEDALLALAAAVEAPAEHPIGAAIVREARRRGLPVGPVRDFEALGGRGASAVVEGEPVTVGAPRLLAERRLTAGSTVREAADRAAAAGQTVVHVLHGDKVSGMIALADVIRPESREAVRTLRERGVRVAMLTGDSRAVADAVARELGIDEVFAEVLPGDKSGTVARLQSDGSRVAMVGDGVNDAPALAQADVGIAIGAGTDVAIESAGVVLASSDPRGASAVIALSRATYRKMLQNLAWATGYNVVALPLAAGVAIGLGLLVSPAVGAVLMSVSTVVVAVNAQLLRRLRL
ncbi:MULTISPECIES: heavy metal translocating P-type ATPase [unclassified Leifsonia]|uniref:heavy metal translocating P-type ATPase n=1 Tax=unclassified Leifsonia TaxID=2663824 RepID=UPI0008A7F024|nr:MULTISPECIES: heavy metal translocating P-type ATPase [unclassified Leifsonia]SEI15756.1 Cu2+-exporting ATPase [Leifsonia sp. CL154]SFL92446.1 Cu2+-exporting ATPase [Leifsonia sp. CL147]